MPVGYYDARVRKLRLVGEGNLWPGSTEKSFYLLSPSSSSPSVNVTSDLGPVHITPGKFKTQQSSLSLGSCLRKTRAEKSRDYCDVIAFETFRFQTVFCPHLNAETMFSNLSSGLGNVFGKLRFRDGRDKRGRFAYSTRKAVFSNFSSVWTGP